MKTALQAVAHVGKAERIELLEDLGGRFASEGDAESGAFQSPAGPTCNIF